MRRFALMLLLGTLPFGIPSCGGGDDGGGDDADPPERGAVVMSLDRDKRELTIENTTGKRLEYGVAYRLERRTANGWRWLNRDSAFILILKVLEPGAREREKISMLAGLEPGHYRIVKAFTDPETRREIRATVEFDVP